LPRKPSQRITSSNPASRTSAFSRRVEELVAPVSLPQPRYDGGLMVEECLRTRRSAREYSSEPLTRSDIGQLLWAAQGVTGIGGLRTAPSAGALYPLRTYLIAGNIAGVPPAVYKYDVDRHELRVWRRGDFRPNLVRGACGQEFVAGAAALILFAVVYRGSIREFGDRGMRLAHIEAGHAGCNVCLQATSMRLGVIGLGAIDPAELKRILELRVEEEPLYLIAVGRKHA
jgi:SagB-type dehydrogenase family enzyme